MADLKSFAQPTNATLYTDVVDTEKGFHGAHAKLVHSDYALQPVGALSLNNPGGATRNLTQWNGTAQTPFVLFSGSGYSAPNYYFNLPDCYLSQDVGGGNPGFKFDAGDYMDYNRASNVWRLVIGNVEKFTVVPGAVLNNTEVAWHQFEGTLYTRHVKLNAPTNQKLWQQEYGDNFKISYTLNDANTVSSVYDRILRNGNAVVSRSLNESNGRLLVGQAVTDDGATALQTTSLKAQSLTLTAQPFISFNGSIPIGTGFGFTAQTASGISVNGPNSSKLTVSKAGKYVINFKEITAFSTNTSLAEFLFNLKKNDLFFSYIRAAFTGNPSFYRATGPSVVLDLLAGDSLSVDRYDGLAEPGNLHGYLYQLS
jgi:hypothetical protein